MGFFPASDGNSLAVIAEEIASMCTEDEQAIWLARQFTAAHSKWPGLSEFRAFYCWCYKPADGINANSQVFADGIPHALLGTPPGRPPLKGETPKLLPPREIAQLSADPGLNDLVQGIAAELPKMPRPRTKEEIEAELYKLKTIEPRGEIKPSKPGLISEADFEALETGEVQ